MKNAEYKFIIEKLVWKDISKLYNNKVPNISQWSGTRVDHAFIYFPIQDAYEWNIKMMFYGTSVSDHFPIILDVDAKNDSPLI